MRHTKLVWALGCCLVVLAPTTPGFAHGSSGARTAAKPVETKTGRGAEERPIDPRDPTSVRWPTQAEQREQLLLNADLARYDEWVLKQLGNYRKPADPEAEPAAAGRSDRANMERQFAGLRRVLEAPNARELFWALVPANAPDKVVLKLFADEPRLRLVWKLAKALPDNGWRHLCLGELARMDQGDLEMIDLSDRATLQALRVAAFETELSRIERNEQREMRRRRSREEHDRAFYALLEDEVLTAEEFLAKRETVERIIVVVDRLKPDQKRLFLTRTFEGVPYEEMARGDEAEATRLRKSYYDIKDWIRTQLLKLDAESGQTSWLHDPSRLTVRIVVLAAIRPAVFEAACQRQAA